MNKIALLILVTGAVLSRFAAAQTAEDLNLTARSGFNAEVAVRNPFWPVGWLKQAPVTAAGPAATHASAPEPLLKAENFLVTSISIGRQPLALINGKLYGEGDLIPLKPPGAQPAVAPVGTPNDPAAANAALRGQIVSIRDGEVRIRFQNETVVARIKGREFGKQ
ncbi:MAG: hypothetical protein WCP06_00540 [Verrucomicrobiota bacterium]